MKVYLVKSKDMEHNGYDEVVSAYNTLEKAEMRLKKLVNSLYEDRFDFIQAAAFIDYVDDHSFCEKDDIFMEKLEARYTQATRVKNEIQNRYSQINLHVLNVDYYIDELEVEE